VRARPEPALAAAARAPGPPHARGGALAHRREHAPRTGTRSRLGYARRKGAAQAASFSCDWSSRPRTTTRRSRSTAT
jgi:hypothetical protein